MKPSELLRAAVKVMLAVDQRMGCCAALFAAAGITGPTDAELIEALTCFDLFRPNGEATWWFGDLTPANEKKRILALLFAAAIAESEGL